MTTKIRDDILEKILENQATGIIQALSESETQKANRYFEAGCKTAERNGKRIDYFPDIVASKLQKMVGQAINERLGENLEEATAILCKSEVILEFLSKKIPTDVADLSEINNFLASCRSMIEKQRSLLKV